MLWYKAWLETRVRFVICLLAITALGIYAASYDIQRADSRTTIDFYYSVVHFAHGLIGGLWIAAVSFLTAGGLLREKGVGAASFTLALPYSRRRLMARPRMAARWMEAVVLIVIPSVAICIEDSMIGKPYPLFAGVVSPCAARQRRAGVFRDCGAGRLADGGSELVHRSACELLCGGADRFLRCTIRRPRSAIRSGIRTAQTHNPFYFMRGAAYFDGHTGLLTGPMPWVQAGIFALLAALFIAAVGESDSAAGLLEPVQLLRLQHGVRGV